MKKFTAILLAVLTIFSAMSMMVFAADTAGATSEGVSTYTCEFCGYVFQQNEHDKYIAHINSYFPTTNHEHVCGRVHPDGTVCTEVFYTKEAYALHCTTCKEASEMDLAKLAFEDGDYLGAIKHFINVVVDFVKSDTFKSITDTVSGIFGKIDFNKIINSVKDVAGKLPLDKIGDLFKK